MQLSSDPTVSIKYFELINTDCVAFLMLELTLTAHMGALKTYIKDSKK